MPYVLTLFGAVPFLVSFSSDMLASFSHLAWMLSNIDKTITYLLLGLIGLSPLSVFFVDSPLIYTFLASIACGLLSLLRNVL